MNVGDYVHVKEYPNHYSVRWSGKIIKIEQSVLPFDMDVTVELLNGKTMIFLESDLALGR